MADNRIPEIIYEILNLIGNANLTFGFVHGTGLGAMLLALVSVELIRSSFLSEVRILNIIKAWQLNK